MSQDAKIAYEQADVHKSRFLLEYIAALLVELNSKIQELINK
jgi:hypothetical protein